MDAERIAVAQRCLSAAEDGTLACPEIVGTLIGAGFEGYTVDYRRNVSTYYLPDGDSVTLEMAAHGGPVAAGFDAEGVAACVREAQANGPGYTYAGFCRKVTAQGCAGYIVSFSGARVLYFGRTAETRLELFPR